MTILPLTDIRGRGLDIVINNIICGSAGIGRQARLRGVCLTTYGFKSHLPHQITFIPSGIEVIFSDNLGLYNQKRIKRTNRSILFTILCVLCLQIHLKFIIFKSFYNAFCYLIIHFTIPPYIIHSLLYFGFCLFII